MEKMNEKTKVYNVIIMDRSGSMWDIQKPAIQGFNEVLGGVKAARTKYADTQEQYITLVLFDSSSIDEVYWNADPSTATILTEETYVPGAATPLYDAMGRTLTKLEKELRDDRNHSVVVTVITDGYENSSREYTLASLRKLIEHLKEEGWSFAYMGTDHDVDAVSVSLSITNVVKFQKTAEETRRIFKKERLARERWYMEENNFNMLRPDATYEEKVRFKRERARRYYEEGPVGEVYADRITPERISVLRPGEIFVFGADIMGRHDGGAARQAVMCFGAQIGVPFGPQGQSFAIPTVGVDPQGVRDAFVRFVDYARQHPDLTFLVTALGCGHGGYVPETMAPLLEEGVRVPNIHYPLAFWWEFEKRGLV